MTAGRFRVQIALLHVESVQTGETEGKLASADVIKATIKIGHAVFKIVRPFMPAGKKRCRQLARLMGWDEFEEINRDVGLLTPMLQTVWHRSGKERFAYGSLGTFQRRQVSRQILNAVDIVL